MVIIIEIISKAHSFVVLSCWPVSPPDWEGSWVGPAWWPGPRLRGGGQSSPLLSFPGHGAGRSCGWLCMQWSSSASYIMTFTARIFYIYHILSYFNGDVFVLVKIYSHAWQNIWSVKREPTALPSWRADGPDPAGAKITIRNLR